MAEVEIRESRAIVFKDDPEKVILVTIPLSLEEESILLSLENDKRSIILGAICKAYKKGCEDGRMLGKSPCLTM
ncbi:MAG: hypothetical protein AAB723_02395 [Patescibacteria group bacterium]